MATKKNAATNETEAQLVADIKARNARLDSMRKTLAKNNFSSAKELLKNHSGHWTESQRQQLRTLLDIADGIPSKKTMKAKATKRTNTLKGRPAPQKYKIPGDTWSGRGKIKKTFVEYAEKHGIVLETRGSGGKDFPLNKAAMEGASAPTKKPVKKAAKKAAKRPAKKAAKKQ